MKLYEGKNNEIRRVMRKHSLRVNRLKRVRYGPYTLGLVPNPGDLQEVSVTADLRKLMYHLYRSRAQEAQQKISQERLALVNEKARKDSLLAGDDSDQEYIDDFSSDENDLKNIGTGKATQ